MKIKVTRKEKREALETIKLNVELWKITKHFFPELISLLQKVKDNRNQSYISYQHSVLLLCRILGAVLCLGSMREMSETLNRSACITNISKILELKEELTELPYWETINKYLERLDPIELENIIPKLIYRLTRMRSFENSRLRNKYWHIVIDGTQLYSFSERHCKHCLTREFKDDNGNILRTEYYHVVLEAKLVINGNIVVSIGTEFIENESENVKKQDCELKAFYRLAEKLKKNFPRMPICIGMDSLYAAAPVFDLCEKYGWKYIIRFKDGSIPTVAKEFHVLKELEPEQIWSKKEGKIIKTYKYVTQITYNSNELNMLEYEQSDMKYPFVFVTNLTITKRNCEQLVIDGRNRWKIENEGFNSQKNHGINLEHMFSRNYNAIKNHYYLMQIGHMIGQLLEAGLRRIRSLGTISVHRIFEDVKEAFRTIKLSDTDRETVEERKQYRFI